MSRSSLTFSFSKLLILSAGISVQALSQIVAPMPTLDVTMQYIQDKLASVGQISYVQTVHNTDTGGYTDLHEVGQLTDVIGQPSGCRITYQETTSTEGEKAESTAYLLSLASILDIVVEPYEIYQSESFRRTGHHLTISSVSPQITALGWHEASSHAHFIFPDETTAISIAKAMVHAVELCGGNRNPFSDKASFLTITHPSAPSEQQSGGRTADDAALAELERIGSAPVEPLQQVVPQPSSSNNWSILGALAIGASQGLAQTSASVDAAAAQMRATQAAQQLAAQQKVADQQAEARHRTEAAQSAEQQKTIRQAPPVAIASASPQPVAPLYIPHAAYAYKGRSYQSHQALIEAALADNNCALHPERGETAPCDLGQIASVQTPTATATSGSYVADAGHCVSAFYDPNYYDWLSYKNICGSSIYVVFYSRDSHHTGSLDIAPGSTGHTAWTQTESNSFGGFENYACPEGTVPVGPGGEYVIGPNIRFRCKEKSH
jgi:hypothetical protein